MASSTTSSWILKLVSFSPWLATKTKWWLGEPLSETVVNSGLKAATYFWPDSEVNKVTDIDPRPLLISSFLPRFPSGGYFFRVPSKDSI
ncbi:hypothetical protein K1719_011128 [Acacia pycnantha]|nr:hypothetical protein K1719_011128 [Acacia pycnantha]